MRPTSPLPPSRAAVASLAAVGLAIGASSSRAQDYSPAAPASAPAAVASPARAYAPAPRFFLFRPFRNSAGGSASSGGGNVERDPARRNWSFDYDRWTAHNL